MNRASVIKTKLRSISVLITSICISPNTYASDRLPDDLFSLSLEELMQIEIYTASQENESAAQSPATISVITAKQLKQWGIISLHDAISLLPGIVKNESYIGQTSQTFRGITPGIFNNKSLYLINGHPTYESLFGSTLLDYIPIEIVERLEVVRSPASVLYGTNAMSGVINIITKQGDDNPNLISLRAGSNSHKYGSIVHHSDGLSIAASKQRDNGYDYSGTLDEFGNEVDLKYHYNLENVFIDGYGDDWRVNAAFFDRNKALFGINPWVWQNGNFETYVGYFDANKSFDINKGELNIWLRYDISDKNIHVGAFPFPADINECTSFSIPTNQCIGTNPSNISDTASTVINTVQRYSIETQYKYKINEQLNYIIGATYEEQTSDPLLFIYDLDDSLNQPAYSDKQNTQTSALYTQIKYQPDDDTIVIAGARGENNSESGSSDIMPRLGVTRQIMPGTYLKMLYSKAFRTPMFIEKYVQLTNVLIGNENLKRETIQTYELGLESQLNADNHLQISLYSTNLQDEILRFPLPAPNPATEYLNGDGKKMHGIEVEWKSVLTDNVELIINTSYLGGKDKSLNEDDAPFIAKQTLNSILTYYATSNWNINFIMQHVGEKEMLTDTNVRSTIDSYTLLNASTTYRMKEHEIRLILNNITDEDYTYPEPVRRKVSEIPGGAGFSSYIQYTYSF